VRRPVKGTSARHIVLIALAVCLAAAIVPATAAAGHVESRFSGPEAFPDPMWESVWKPQVSGTNVAFQALYFEEHAGAAIWTIGGACTASTVLADASGFDCSGELIAYALAGDIYVTDGVASHPVCTATGQQIHPRIDGLTIVWQDRRDGTWDIYAATIDGATFAVTREWPVCVAPRAQTLPDVGGDSIVWEDRRDAQPDIWSQRISTETNAVVCGTACSQTEPRTDGAWVVWTDRRSGATGPDIYGRRFGGAVRRICQALKTQDGPDVSDGFVVWRDFRSRHERTGFEDPVQTSVRGCELSSRDVFVVADPRGQESQVDMDAHTVVWTHFPRTFRDRPWYGLVYGAVLQH
jgi:beta propeller repeat protein